MSATHRHSHTHAGELTRNQSLVFGTLSASEGPLSAYSILDDLRGDGMRAPLQIYRALDRLVELGMVHRLESMNAFVACTDPDCASHELAAFTICEKCGLVREVADEKLSASIDALDRKSGFATKKAVVELRGLCAECSA